MEGELAAHPDNPSILIPKLRAGFVLSGMEAREDFGMLVVMTKFLTAIRDKGWRQKFLYLARELV